MLKPAWVETWGGGGGGALQMLQVSHLMPAAGSGRRGGKGWDMGLKVHGVGAEEKFGKV